MLSSSKFRGGSKGGHATPYPYHVCSSKYVYDVTTLHTMVIMGQLLTKISRFPIECQKSYYMRWKGLLQLFSGLSLLFIDFNGSYGLLKISTPFFLNTLYIILYVHIYVYLSSLCYM